MVRNTDAEWKKFGRQDPYYGVLSQDKYRKGNLTPAALREFFDSGRQHMDFVLATIRRHLDPQFRPRRALDFGCGVGRCLIPMAALTPAAVGLDISEAMLAEARRNCEQQGVRNIELVLSDDTLSRLTGAFDLAHAILVFQHIPPARGVALFARLVERLADGGVGVVQVPYHRGVAGAVKALGALRKHVPLAHNLANLAGGKPWSEPLMEKNCYDLNRLLRVLQEGRCGRLHVEFQGRGRLLSAILFFQKQAGWVPYEPFGEAAPA